MDISKYGRIDDEASHAGVMDAIAHGISAAKRKADSAKLILKTIAPNTLPNYDSIAALFKSPWGKSEYIVYVTTADRFTHELFVLNGSIRAKRLYQEFVKIVISDAYRKL